MESGSVSFTGLVLGFSSAALSYLGLDHSGANPSIGRNLQLAKQNIDILHLLEKKTSGNLDQEEQELLRQVLVDLKEKFVEAAKEQGVDEAQK